MSNDQHFLEELARILNGSKIASEPRSSELNDFLSHLGNEHSLQVTLSGDDGFALTEILSFHNGSCTFTGISAGEYQLTLCNGRVLWQGQLKEEDLVLENEIPLKLAADTGTDGAEATALFELIPSECEMIVLPGLESGTVKIQTI